MLKVLYVDDDPDIREIVSLSLGLDPGFSVETADSGSSALAAIDAGLTPDVIVTDVMMPVMDGPATLAEIRRRPHLQATPVIFLTARAQAKERTRFIELGAADVITKPFDPTTLAKELRSIVGS